MFNISFTCMLVDLSLSLTHTHTHTRACDVFYASYIEISAAGGTVVIRHMRTNKRMTRYLQLHCAPLAEL